MAADSLGEKRINNLLKVNNGGSKNVIPNHVTVNASTLNTFAM